METLKKYGARYPRERNNDGKNPVGSSNGLRGTLPVQPAGRFVWSSVLMVTQSHSSLLRREQPSKVSEEFYELHIISMYFSGRKAALQHMLKTGLYSQHDVDLMKNHLNVISKVSDIWTLGERCYTAEN